MGIKVIHGIALIAVALVARSDAAQMTLVRSSRLVTAAEVADGAPSGGMVHEFYATSDADLLTLATNFSQGVYQHPYGSATAAPPAELTAYFPGLTASSFLTTPGSTFVLGGGFTGTEVEKAWADLSNDGAQTDFLFGRLTTTESGSFDGYFAVRGQETYIEMPFNFLLPGITGPLTETLYVSGVEQSQGSTIPPEASPIEPTPTLNPEPVESMAPRFKMLRSLLGEARSNARAHSAANLGLKDSLIQIVAQRGRASGVHAAVPEPSAVVLVVVGLSGLLWSRSRKMSSPIAAAFVN